MVIERLAVTTNSSQVGSTTAVVEREGYVQQVDLNYSASAEAGTDVTLQSLDESGVATTLLTITNTNTDGSFWPLGAPCLQNGTVSATPAMPIRFKGKLKLSVAQGGVSITDCVIARIHVGGE